MSFEDRFSELTALRVEMAFGISDSNWVTGVGIYNGYDRRFLMQLPEPATSVIVGIFAATCALMRRRNRSLFVRRPFVFPTASQTPFARPQQ